MKKSALIFIFFIIFLIIPALSVFGQDPYSVEEPENLTLEQIFLGLQEIPMDQLALIIETGSNHDLILTAIELLVNNGSPEAKELLMKALEIGVKNVQAENGEITNDWWDIRVEACIALGKLKAVEAVDALIATLVEDSDPIVKTYAAIALGQIGDKRAVAPLIHMLDYFKGNYTSTTAPLMYGIISALGDIGSPDAFGVLLEVSQGPYPSFIRQSAIMAIKKIQFAVAETSTTTTSN